MYPVEAVEDQIFLIDITRVLHHRSGWYPQKNYWTLISINKKLSVHFLTLRPLKEKTNLSFKHKIKTKKGCDSKKIEIYKK